MRPIYIRKSITNKDSLAIINYLKEVAKIPLITQEEEVKLSERIQNGDKKALDKLVTSNLRFAISIAKQYQNKGLPLLDLISEANLGLIHAARKFIPNENYRFVSYAVWWIRDYITKAIANYSSTIRVPIGQQKLVARINKIYGELSQDSNKVISSEDIGEKINLESDKVDSAINTNTIGYLSLDISVDDSSNMTLVDVLPNENSSRADEKLLKDSLYNEILEAIDFLPDRDRDILIMSFGIGMEEMTNEAIADKFGITPTRVRQLKNESLVLLKEKYKTISNMLAPKD